LSPVVIVDFTGIASIEHKNTLGDIQWPAGSKSAWNDYPASILAKTEGVFKEGRGGLYVDPQMTSIEFILPANYNWFHLIVPAPDAARGGGQTGLFLSMDNNFVKYCAPPIYDYKQAYTPLQTLKVQEGGGVLGYDLKLSIYSSATGALVTGGRYVKQECNASRDVICVRAGVLRQQYLRGE
jgi:hypothetical protein